MSAHVRDWHQQPDEGPDYDANLSGNLRPDRGTAAADQVTTRVPRWAARIWLLLSPVLLSLWARVEARRVAQRGRSLRVVETVAMGEKRFVAIVQVQDARFLIGGGSAGVSLLARLDREQEFAVVLGEQAASPVSEISANHIREAW